MRKRKAFTLVELLVIITILGILATVVIANYVTEIPKAKRNKAMTDMRMIMDALERYRLNHGDYPTTAQGLQALVTKPSGELKNPDAYPKNGYIIGGIPKDPWGNEYAYIYPGSSRQGLYDLICYGADGREGGEGYDADITNFTLMGASER